MRSLALQKKYYLVFFPIIFILCCLLLLFTIFGSQENGKAFNNSDTNFTSIGELWNGSSFDLDNFDTLMRAISGDSTASSSNMTKIKSMASSKTTAETMKNNNGNEIVVTLGGLTWTPTYLSTDKSGNSILTLWLSNSSQLSGKYYSSSAFRSTGTAKWASFYSNDTSNAYPCAMYGMSYMRAVVLNNGGSYATSNTTSTSFTQALYTAFAPFTISKEGEKNDITDFIVKPIDVSWQESGQSAKNQLGPPNYNYPNENWSNSVSDTGFYSSSYNYAHKTGNDAWKNDYIWLPSVTETGYSDSNIGIWHTSTAQRQNVTTTWLRSGSAFKANTAICLPPEGGSVGYSESTLNGPDAVRPALHLNLDSAAALSAAAPEVEISLRSGYGNNSALGQVTVRYCRKGSSVSVPSRTGYVFKGYYTGMYGGGTQYIDLNGNWTRAWAETNKDKLYASWTAESYDIIFEGNGGEINSASSHRLKLSYGTTTTITPSWEGHEFLYFTQEQSPSTSSTKYYLDGTSFKVNTDFGNNGVIVTLYAQWQVKSYKISFDANGGTINGTATYTETYNYGEKITLNKDTSGNGNRLSFYLYKKGYKFLSFDKGTLNEGKTTLTIPDLGQNNLEVLITVQWEERSYKINFDPGGKTFKGTPPPAQTKKYTQDITLPDAQCEGFIFAGWYAKDTSGNTYKYNQSVSMKELTQGKESADSITLYAKWEDTWANHVIEPDKISLQSMEYLISKPEHLGWLSLQLQKNHSFMGYTFKQVANIDLNNYPWLSYGTFDGIYNGNGYHIFNIHTSANPYVAGYDYQGLFSKTSNAVLMNISILTGNISGGNYVGSIVGSASSTFVQNCINHASVKGIGSVGGIIGYKEETSTTNASAKIIYCLNYGTVTGSGDNVGGLIGSATNSEINGCYVRANVFNDSINLYVGGIVGRGTNVTVTQCAFVGDVDSDSGNGILKFISGKVEKCLVDTTSKTTNVLPSQAVNCISYVDNVMKNSSSMNLNDWAIINGRYFPKGLTWLG